jgi:hypothetical protein
MWYTSGERHSGAKRKNEKTTIKTNVRKRTLK